MRWNCFGNSGIPFSVNPTLAFALGPSSSLQRLVEWQLALWLVAFALLVLSAQLRRFLFQLFRLVVIFGGPGAAAPVVPLDPRGRLQQYRA